MKYKQRDELVSSLRELADFIEAHGLELPEIDIRATSIVYSHNPVTWEEDELRPRRVMRRIAKILGKAEKRHGSYYFDLRRKFGVIILEFSTPRKNICKRIVTGVKHHEEQVIAARTEELVEWVCDDPILSTVGEED